GEGAISLAYAFAQAGCPSLVTTIWEANENTTGFLNRRLTRYIEEGVPLDAALQKARKELRSDGEYSKYDHPDFWANLSLIGNHASVYPARAIPDKYWYGTFALAIICLAIVFLRRSYLI